MRYLDLLNTDFGPDHPCLNEAEIKELNANVGGMNKRLGFVYRHVAPDKVVLAVEVGEHLLQPHGLVNGGVYCALVESAASTGALLASGKPAVGMNNSTDFLTSVREGELVATATPVKLGKRTHLWRVDITKDERLVSQGTLRLMILD